MAHKIFIQNGFGFSWKALLRYGSTGVLGLVLILLLGSQVNAQSVLISQGGTQYGCSGNFYDSGFFGTYSNNENFTITLCPDTTLGTEVQVNFTFFDLDFGDQLTIYDGPDNTSSVIGVFSLGSPGNITPSSSNTSGCLTFNFTSDNFFTTQGWEADINCGNCQPVLSHILSTNPATEPVPDSIYINICQGDTVQFSGYGSYPQSGLFYLQSDLTSAFSWDFGDGNSDTNQNTSHVFNAVGGWRTRLTITDSNNCQGTPVDLKVRVSSAPTFSGTMSLLDTICDGDTVALVGQYQSVDGVFGAAGIVAGQTFLPDGTGTSYETTITISNFDPLDTVASITDITQICANMEHSFLGDLDIELICPDNTLIRLKNFPGGGSTFLGSPPPGAGTNPGIGWDYCWNSTPTYGTMNDEATGACPICISPPSPPGAAGNSLPPGTYTPLDNLSNLIGCPLNGDWTIRVTDNLGIDNGYIFNWSIEFDTSLIATEVFSVPVDSTIWSGANIVQSVNDSTVLVAPTSSGNQDNTYTVFDSYGCSFDTTISFFALEKPDADFSWIANCVGDSIQFTDLSTTPIDIISKWYWDFGDGSPIDTLQNPSHVYDTAGFYQVLLTVETTIGCRGSIVLDSIEVYFLPTPDFSFQDVCFGDTMFFSDSSTAQNGMVNQWMWNFGDNTSSTATNPNHVFPQDTLFPVVLTVTTDLGCTDSILKWVNNYELPVVNIGIQNICEGNSSQFTDQSVGYLNNPILAWAWDVNADGSVESSLSQTTFSYPSAGTFPVQLTVEDSLGCEQTGIDSIVINPRPMASFSSTNVCVGAPTLFLDSSSVVTGSIADWIWDFGDGSPLDTIFNPAHSYSAAGTFGISLTVVTDSNCLDTTTGVVNIVVFPLPVTDFSFELACHPDPATFTDLSTIPSTSITDWSWSFGEMGASSSLQHPQYAYSTPGTYEVSLFATSIHGCATLKTDSVEVFKLPVVDFSFSDHCLNETSLFTNLSTISQDTIQSYAWDFGSGQLSAQEDPDVVFPLSGTFSVQLIATANTMCRDSLSQDIVVFPLPDVDFQFQNVCEDSVVNFTDLTNSPNGSSLTNWFWDFENDGVADSTSQNTSTVYTAFGGETIELLVVDGLGCRDSLAQAIAIHPNPISFFSFADVCFEEAVLFQDNSTVGAGDIVAWEWNFGDLSPIGTGSSVSHNYAADGTFSVVLTVETDSGCTNITLPQSVVVFPKPQTDYSVMSECQYEQLDFLNGTVINAPGSIVGWEWDFGDGDSSVLENPQHQFPTHGFFDVTLVAESADGCRDTTQTQVEVYSVPEANFFVSTICDGDLFQFQNISDIPDGTIEKSWWNLLHGDTSNLVNPTYAIDTAGIYDIQLIVTSDHQCQDSLTKPIEIHPSPQALFTYEPNCIQNPMVFTNQSVALGGSILEAYSWDFADGTPLDNLMDPTHVFDSAGFYPVHLKVTTLRGCSDTITQLVEVLGLPEVLFNAIPDDGCSRLPVFLENNSFFNGEGSLTYTWQIGGDTTQYNEEELLLHFENRSEGIHFIDVGLTVTSELCSNTFVKEDLIQVRPRPTAILVANPRQVSVYDGRINFENRSLNDLWSTWDFGNGNMASNTIFPTVQYENAGTYPVSLEVENEFGCLDTALQHVVISAEVNYYIPNSFTPNGDGINDFFSGAGEAYETDFEFQIFDRWGNRVFYSTDPDAQWNGLYEAQPAPQGVYIYRISFVDEIEGKEVIRTGEVALLRGKSQG